MNEQKHQGYSIEFKNYLERTSFNITARLRRLCAIQAVIDFSLSATSKWRRCGGRLCVKVNIIFQVLFLLTLVSVQWSLNLKNIFVSEVTFKQVLCRQRARDLPQNQSHFEVRRSRALPLLELWNLLSQRQFLKIKKIYYTALHKSWDDDWVLLQWPSFALVASYSHSHVYLFVKVTQQCFNEQINGGSAPVCWRQ